MTARRWGWCGGLLVFIIALGHRGGWGETPPATGPRPAVARRIEIAVPRGAGSCAATACHGNNVPLAGDILRNEHTTWISKDPHAEAYQPLFSDRSRAIARKLSGGEVPAHKESRCLACHATSTPNLSQAEVLHQDGVSCESCHGPSRSWIGPHTRFDWSGNSDRIKEEQYGMVPLRDLSRRAEACAGCHVGSPAAAGFPLRDVDHDLIAAGHPRLTFEFSAYMAMMPAHWVEKGINAGGDFSVRCWTVGQAVSARAALALLGDRARRAGEAEVRGEPSSWPEFAEYGCFSCHHDLRDEPWRRDGRRPETLLGVPKWGSWYYPLMSVLAKADPAPGDGLVKDIGGLGDAMNRPEIEPKAASTRADAADRSIRVRIEALANKRYDPGQVEGLIAALKEPGSSGRIESWDQHTQCYLGLAACQQSLDRLRGRVDPAARKELIRLRDFLQYPAKYDSPRQFNPNTSPTKP